MNRVEKSLLVMVILLAAAVAWAGNGKGKPGGGGGGGEEPAPDPAIAFAKGGSRGDIVVMNADGSNETVVLAGEGHVFATWSPDGQSLVFWSDVQGFGIYVVDLDGTGLRKVASVQTGLASRPVWSPVPLGDGKYKIAFCDYPVVDGVVHQVFDVFLVNPDGTGRVNLTNSPNDFETYPSWSPDATRMAAERVPANAAETADLLVLEIGADLSVTSTRNVTDGDEVPDGTLNHVDVHYPMWANHANRIAVSANTGSGYDLFLVDPDDPADPERLLETTSPDEVAPSWSPGDDALTFVGASQKGREEGIYVMDLQSRVAERIRSGAGGFGAPAWRRNP